MFNDIGTGGIFVLLLLIIATACMGKTIATKQAQQDDNSGNSTTKSELSDMGTATVLTSEVITPFDSLLTQDKLIFFPVQSHAREKVEIWQIDIANNHAEMLFETSVKYPTSVLPASELSLLEESYFCETQPESCPNELNYSLTNLKLSPSKTFLAWQERITWCPNTGCYGLSRIVVYDLTTEQSRVLVELPIHIETTATQALGEIVWAPNSKQVAFSVTSRQEGWSFVRTVDIETKQVKEVGEGLNPLAWSPDNELIAVTAGIPQEQRWTIEIISRTGQLTATFGKWDLIESIDWSSSLAQLAVTALANYQNTGSPASSLFVIDLDLGEMKEANLIPEKNLDYSEPHWSPDGQLLGVNVSENQLNKSLIISDPNIGEIKTSFTPEFAFDKWTWSYDGRAILMMIGGDSVFHPFSPQKIGIFLWETGEFRTVRLPPQLEEELKNREAILGSPTW